MKFVRAEQSKEGWGKTCMGFEYNETTPRKSAFGDPLPLGYHRGQETWEERIKDIFGESLPEISKGVILDWGCSHGVTTEELKEIYPNSLIIGLDISLRMLARAKMENREGYFILGDGYKMPFATEAFDAIFCTNNVLYSVWDHPFSLWGERNIAIKRIRQIGRSVGDKGYLLVGCGPFSDATPPYAIFQKNGNQFVLQSQQRAYHKDGKDLEINKKLNSLLDYVLNPQSQSL